MAIERAMSKMINNKNRVRGVPLIRFLLFVAICSVCWYLCAKPEHNVAEKHISEPIQSAVSAAATPVRTLESYIVRPGDTFEKILGSFGISSALSLRYSASLASAGLSAIFPGDSVVLQLAGEEKKLEKFSLLSRLSNWYHLTCDSNSTYKTVKETVPTTRYRCIAKGTLTSCLSLDMLEIGVGDALVAKLTDIFAWDINFFMDPRKGDTFEVLFEKLYREGRFVGYGKILAAKYVNGDREHYAIALGSDKTNTDYFDLEGRSVQKQFLKAPLRYNRISSGFSLHRKHPILGIVRPHLGIDYAAPRGTPVYAAADGKVTFAGANGGFGRFIRISHGGAYETNYGHLHKIGKGIHAGARVAQGQVIGTVGATGLATGPHLDYRMKKGSRFVNPQTVSLPSKKGVSQEDFKRFEEERDFYMTILESRGTQKGYFVLDIRYDNPQENNIAQARNDNATDS